MLHLIDGITGKARHFQGHHYAISGIAISHDEKTVFTGSADQTVRFWNATTGEQARLVRNNDHFIDGLALSSNGKYLIAQRTERIGDGEQSFVPIDTRTGKQKQWNQVLPIQARHRSFHINGSTLTEQEELGVMVRDLWTLKRIRSLQFKKRKWRAIQLLPDGEHVLAIGEKPDGPWTIWNVKTRQEVSLRSHPMAHFWQWPVLTVKFICGMSTQRKNSDRSSSKRTKTWARLFSLLMACH